MEQQHATHQQATAELQERILRNEVAAAAAVAAAREVTQANAVTMANALAAAGIGLAPVPRNPDNDNSKSSAKMPIFEKEEGKDFLIFEQKFRAYALLQKLNNAKKKLNLFMALEGEAASLARIFGPGTEVFDANDFDAYFTQLKLIFSTRAAFEAAKSKFESRRQKKGENCQTYAANKMALWLTAYPTNTDKSLLIREYICGMSDSRVQKRVVLQGSDDFRTAVNYASDMEAGFEYIGTLQNRSERQVDAPRVTKEPTPEEAMDLSAMLATEKTMQRDRFGRYVQNDNCHKCGEEGHWKNECPKNTGGYNNNNGRGRGQGRGYSGRGRGHGRGRGIN